MVWNSPVMTGNTTPPPYVVSASSEYSAQYAAWAAMDGDTSISNYWNTNGPANPNGVAWWQICMGVGNPTVCVTTLTIKNLATYGYTNFKLQGSNNGADWTDIYTGYCDDNSNTQTYNSLGNSNYYAYYRVLCITGYSADYLVVTEITMSGETSISNYLHARRDRMNMRGVSTQNQLA